MRRLVALAALVIGTSQAAPLRAQSGALTLEAVVGLVHRAPTPQDVAQDGVHAAFRLALKPGRTFRVVAGLNWTRLPDQDLNVPVLCPQTGNPCAAGQRTLPGLGMLGSGLGLEAVLRPAGFELRPSAMAGGYALYHRPGGVPGLAAGFDLGLGLGLPIGARERILLEGRWVHLLGEAGGVASGRRLNIGIALH